MIDRIFKYLDEQSFFLFGPRGTGKSSWLQTNFPSAIFINLLDSGIHRELSARPERLQNYIAGDDANRWLVIDEVQLVPALLNEVHRLIEERKIKVALSGSSARKLRAKGINLLAGRAITESLHPFTPRELGAAYDHELALQVGLMPQVWDKHRGDRLGAMQFLRSYVGTYLKEEIQQEGITRNVNVFSQFLEIASFSQGSPVVVSNIAKELHRDAKTVESYFVILEDLLLARRIPVFTKHAKREMYLKPKFFYFDVGVYRALRPAGVLDTPEHIDGAALETLLFQQLRAYNDYYRLGFNFYHWRTREHHEIDLVLYGQKGLFAFEVKRSATIRDSDLKAVKMFSKDYPEAKVFVLYGGEQSEYHGSITIMNFERAVEKFLQVVTPPG
jgi:uncharacterized protein